MTVQVFDRGNVVDFAAEFHDRNGDAVLPETVTVTLSYIGSSGSRATTAVTLDAETDSFSGSWSTGATRPGRVFWSVKTTGPVSAEDGFFDLSANAANLAT